MAFSCRPLYKLSTVRTTQKRLLPVHHLPQISTQWSIAEVSDEKQISWKTFIDSIVFILLPYFQTVSKKDHNSVPATSSYSLSLVTKLQLLISYKDHILRKLITGYLVYGYPVRQNLIKCSYLVNSQVDFLFLRNIAKLELKELEQS